MLVKGRLLLSVLVIYQLYRVTGQNLLKNLELTITPKWERTSWVNKNCVFENTPKEKKLRRNLGAGREILRIALGTEANFTVTENDNFRFISTGPRAIAVELMKLDGLARPVKLSIKCVEETHTVTITLHGEDECTPKFETSPHPLQIRESHKKSDTIGVVRVSTCGAEETNKGKVDVILGQNEYLTLSKASTDDYNLSLRKVIDEDTPPALQATIRAEDRGSPSYSNTTVLDIKVIKFRRPTFTQQKYTATLLEHDSQKTFIPYQISLIEPIHAEATADSGEKLQIEYTIVCIDTSYCDHFHINSDSAALTLIKELDSETINATDLYIYVDANLKESAKYSSRVLLVVTLTTVDEFPPKITTEQKDVPTLHEPPNEGDELFTVTVVDPDFDPSSHFIFHSKSDHCQVDQNGRVVSSGFETITFPETRAVLCEFCVSNGKHSTCKKFQINLSWKPPVFDRSPYMFNVTAEGTSVQTPLKVQTEYQGSSTSANVEYFITSNYKESFQIDASGNITVVRYLPTGTYNLTVQALVKLNSRLISDVPVFITLNQAAPQHAPLQETSSNMMIWISVAVIILIVVLAVVIFLVKRHRGILSGRQRLEETNGNSNLSPNVFDRHISDLEKDQYGNDVDIFHLNSRAQM